jgi:hypothetical protein
MRWPLMKLQAYPMKERKSKLKGRISSQSPLHLEDTKSGLRVVRGDRSQTDSSNRDAIMGRWELKGSFASLRKALTPSSLLCNMIFFRHDQRRNGSKLRRK